MSLVLVVATLFQSYWQIYHRMLVGGWRVGEGCEMACPIRLLITFEHNQYAQMNAGKKKSRSNMTSWLYEENIPGLSTTINRSEWLEIKVAKKREPNHRLKKMKRITFPLQKGKYVSSCYAINGKELNLNGTKTWNWNWTWNGSFELTYLARYQERYWDDRYR